MNLASALLWAAWPAVLARRAVLFSIGLCFFLPRLCLAFLLKGSAAFKSPSVWNICQHSLCGKHVFSVIVGLYAPYSATVGATITCLSENGAEGTMEDWPWLRNPFDSVHAVCLANFAELVTGCAVTFALDSLPQQGLKGRGIVSAISCEYLKKARGSLTCSCHIKIPREAGRHAIKVEATIRDSSFESCATFTGSWTVDITAEKSKSS
eukprot:m.153513 g.153513  ORF g.153513 m.153513 type:complete len:209 (-) comp20761_c0_seq1:68-694(-)